MDFGYYCMIDNEKVFIVWQDHPRSYQIMIMIVTSLTRRTPLAFLPLPIYAREGPSQQVYIYTNFKERKRNNFRVFIIRFETR